MRGAAVSRKRRVLLDSVNQPAKQGAPEPTRPRAKRMAGPQTRGDLGIARYRDRTETDRRNEKY